jgi:hypothetical protein
VELNRSLTDRLDDAAFRQRLTLAADRLLALAGQLLARAEAEFADIGDEAGDLKAQLAARQPEHAYGSMLFAPMREMAPA